MPTTTRKGCSMEQDQNLGDAGERQDPAEQYQTDQAVETDAQPSGDTARVNGTDYDYSPDRGYREPQAAAPQPVEVAPSEPESSSTQEVGAPESGDVSQESSSDDGGGGDASSSDSNS